MADPDDISLPVHEFALTHRGVQLVVCAYPIDPLGTLAIVVFRMVNRKGAERCKRLEVMAAGAWQGSELVTLLEQWPLGLPFVVQNALAREVKVT